MSTAFVYCITCGAANPPAAPTCFACGNPPLEASTHAPSSSLPTTQLSAQALLKQRYRRLSQVGKGGFGAVYEAEDSTLANRKVAIKEMSQRGLTPEELQEATQAFHNEARLLATLAHPNLPRIYDQFEESGRWYLVMEFIEGETLEERLTRTPGGCLPVAQVLSIGVHLCLVLEYLHTRQPPIIFRDLKPANIMLTSAGGLYLIDFGIARHFKPGQTSDTVAFGSAGYAAPEQYGKAQTTTQSDIYSLGATLHQLLSGTDPSTSPFIFVPLQLAEPEGLSDLIGQMLETHQSKRPASMAFIQQDLERLAHDLAIGRKQQSPFVRTAFSPGRAALSPHTLFRGHTDQINTVAWSPDGKRIASGGHDQTIQIWESASGKRRHTFPEVGRVHALAWSPSGEQLAWVSKGRVVHLWDTEMGNPGQLALRRPFFFAGFLALAWSPDSACLAAGGPGKTVEIWDVQTGKHLLTYDLQRRSFEDASVCGLAWSPDGKWIASACAGATVQVWEAATGQLRCVYQEYRYVSGGALAWAPDGTYIASAGSGHTVHIWDAAAGNGALVLSGHTGPVKAVAWSPDGTSLASGGSDRTVLVWDLAAGKAVQAYFNHTRPVNTIAWSPDSTCLASAGDDQTVHVWQVRQARVLP